MKKDPFTPFIAIIFIINNLYETETEVMNASQYIENAVNEHLKIKKYSAEIEEFSVLKKPFLNYFEKSAYNIMVLIILCL